MTEDQATPPAETPPGEVKEPSEDKLTRQFPRFTKFVAEVLDMEECAELPAEKPPGADPVCLIHGLKHSEHHCLYCCLCFRPLEPAECSYLPNGKQQDICVPCAEEEHEGGLRKLKLCRVERDKALAQVELLEGNLKATRAALKTVTQERDQLRRLHENL